LELSTSENLYEEFWQSDDELDREELDELCGGSVRIFKNKIYFSNIFLVYC